jgi:fatty-acid desaturase
MCSGRVEILRPLCACPALLTLLLLPLLSPCARRASSHRYHHVHCDTPLDPHSPYEGFWWSHMGWLLDNKVGGWCSPTVTDCVLR